MMFKLFFAALLDVVLVRFREDEGNTHSLVGLDEDGAGAELVDMRVKGRVGHSSPV